MIRKFHSICPKRHYKVHLQATQSALLNVCVGNGELALARQVYDETSALGLRPHAHAYNGLINAYARHFRLGDVVRSLQLLSRHHGWDPPSVTCD